MNSIGNGKKLPACCSSFFILLIFSISGDRGTLELRKSLDNGKTFKTIGSRIYSFGLGGRFVFASIMTDSVSSHDVLCIILFQNQVCCLLRLHLRKKEILLTKIITYTLLLKSLGLQRSHLCSPSLHLYDQIYSKYSITLVFFTRAVSCEVEITCRYQKHFFCFAGFHTHDSRLSRSGGDVGYGSTPHCWTQAVLLHSSRKHRYGLHACRRTWR